MNSTQRHCIFIALPALLLLSACSFWSDKSNAPALVPAFQLPPPPRISGDEIARLRAGCERWYDSFLLRSGFAGGMLVARSGNVVFERYQGLCRTGTSDSMSYDRPLHIASVSKTFTAMAVLKLWQDHMLQLSDELTRFFPGFPYPGVTIQDLLNHRSGLPNYTHFMEELNWDKKTPVTNDTVLSTLMRRKSELKNIGSPNRQFSYCNTNYALLALIIEQVTGETFPAYMKRTLFEPLGLSHTYVYTSADSLRSIPSYNWRGYQEAFMYLDPVYGDKNIYSTPEDLLKWDRLLCSGQYLNDTTLAAAYTPYSQEKPGVRNYGLGWRMLYYPDGYKIIYHNGWWHGSNAVFIRLPEEDATIIVLGNRFNRNIYKARNLISLMGRKPMGEEGDE